MTQLRKFNLYGGENVSIDQVVAVLGELSTAIKMNGTAKTSNKTWISCEAPIDVYTGIFGATLIEKDCTYFDCPDHSTDKKYFETVVPPRLPDKLKPYLHEVVDANNHKTQEEIDLLNRLMKVFGP